MIYPRLKLKSTVISGVLDGKENNFVIRKPGDIKTYVSRKEENTRKRYKKQLEKYSKNIDPSNKTQASIKNYFFKKPERNQLKLTSHIKSENPKVENSTIHPFKTQSPISSPSQSPSSSPTNSPKTLPPPVLFTSPIIPEGPFSTAEESWTTYSNPMYDLHRKLRYQKSHLIWDSQTFDKFTPVWKQMKGVTGRPKNRQNVTIDEQICIDMEENEIQKPKVFEGEKPVVKAKRKRWGEVEEVEGGEENVGRFLGDYLRTRKVKVEGKRR
jgi:hypothetical protein